PATFHGGSHGAANGDLRGSDPSAWGNSMGPEQVRLVKSSFASVLPIAEEAGKMFYERLFALDPALRPLFKGDMAEQSQNLKRLITVAVNARERLDASG